MGVVMNLRRVIVVVLILICACGGPSEAEREAYRQCTAAVWDHVESSGLAWAQMDVDRLAACGRPMSGS